MANTTRKILGELQTNTTLKLKSSSNGGSTPQSLAYVSESEQVVICSNSNKIEVCSSSSVLANYTLGKDIGNCNGGTYCSKDNSIYVTGTSSNNKIYKITKNAEGKWKNISSITLPVNSSGLAYDSTTNCFYVGTGSTVYVFTYDNFIKGRGSKSSFSCTKFSGWTADTYWQDLGGSGGIVLRCVSKSEVDSQVSYVDCYEASSGKYTGSYKYSGGELTSVAMDSSGNMHVLTSTSRELLKVTAKNVAGSDDGGYGGAKAINDTALKLAWPSGTSSSKYTYGSGSGTEEFKKAFNKAYPKHSSWGSWQGKNGPANGASCDVFAGTVLIASGYYPGAPRGLSSQLSEFPKSKKFTTTKYNGAPSSKSAVQPGDIVMYKKPGGAGHIMVICKEKGKTVIAEAAVNKYYGHINTNLGKVTTKSSKICTYVCRPSGMVTGDGEELIGTKGYVPGFSYGGGIKELYSTDNYEYIYDEETQEVIKNRTEDTTNYMLDFVKDVHRLPAQKKEQIVPDEVYKQAVSSGGQFDVDKPERYYEQSTTNKLTSADSLVQAPVIMVDFNGTTIGGFGNSGDKYPNYITSVTTSRINGKINTYTITISYQVRPNEDANFIDKLISKCGYTNPIKIKYGDSNSPKAIFKEEEALITDVQYGENVAASTISYTIQAVSSIVTGTSSTSTYGLKQGKISDIIYDLVYGSGDDSRYLLDLFPGMRNRNLVSTKGLIPANDVTVVVPPVKRVNVLSYLSYLVSCMKNSSEDKSSYFLTYHDDTTNEFGGPYFKITEVKSYNSAGAMPENLDSPNFYQVDVGYPDENMVMNFSIDSNQYWNNVYEYNYAIPEYRYGIDDEGNITSSTVNRLYSDNNFLKENIIASNWWRDATEFPISAKLTLKGVLRPVMLMTYIRVNTQFFGNRDIASGIYVVTEHRDTINDRGFFTELTLLRVAGDNPNL